VSTEDNIILLVEDNEDDVLLTERAFRRANIGNPVVVARDGVEALDYFFGPGAASRAMPQVVLLDLNLPRIGGLEVLRRLRESARTKTVPVVVLTSSKQEEDVLESYSLGANSYVRKPVDFGEFAQAAKVLGLFWLLVNQVVPSGPAGGDG
jgi:two-component system response regulator